MTVVSLPFHYNILNARQRVSSAAIVQRSSSFTTSQNTSAICMCQRAACDDALLAVSSAALSGIASQGWRSR